MRVLIITPHPDDVEAVVGGLVARLIDEGNEVECMYLTSGEMGADQPYRRGKRLAEIREKEAIKAAKITKMKVLGFMGFPDTQVMVTRENIDRIKSLIQSRNPSVLFAPEPYYSWYTHRDHLNTGKLVLEAWKELGRKQRLLFYHTRAPNVWFDITRWTFRGFRALLTHKSQQPDVIFFTPLLFLFFSLPRPGRLTVGLRDPTKTARIIFPIFSKIPENLYHRRENTPPILMR